MNDGGPAFPITYQHEGINGEEHTQRWAGMSLRDWFAGQVVGHAIQNITVEQMQLLGGREVLNQAAARMAYEIADTMLKAREPRQE